MSTNVDSENKQPETVASQATDNSEASSAQPSQTIDYVKLAEELFSQEDTKEYLRRAAQGDKDKSVAELKGEVSNLTRAFELYGKGKTPEEAQDQMDFEDNVTWLREQRSLTQKSASEADDGEASLDVSTQLKQAGIDPSSDYGKLVASGLENTKYQNPTQLNRAIMQEMGRLASKPTASGASTTIPSGGSPSSSAEALLNELAALNAKPSADDSKRVAEIQRELKKLD